MSIAIVVVLLHSSIIPILEHELLDGSIWGISDDLVDSFRNGLYILTVAIIIVHEMIVVREML